MVTHLTGNITNKVASLNEIKVYTTIVNTIQRYIVGNSEGRGREQGQVLKVKCIKCLCIISPLGNVTLNINILHFHTTYNYVSNDKEISLF